MNVNEAYINFIRDNKKYILLIGGAGSGKSHAVAQKLVIRCLNETGHKFLVLRKIGRNLKNSVYDEIKNVIDINDLSDSFDMTTSPLKIRCLLNNNEIIFSGIDDPEKIKSIQGITGIWVEEATELMLKDFTQLKLRLRGPTDNYKQIVLSFNPIDARLWIKKYFFDDLKEDENEVSIYKTTYKDNVYLDASDAKTIEDLLFIDENAYNIYARGEWGSLSDAMIYDPNKWQVADVSLDYNNYKQIIAGVDFAYVAPSAVVILGIDNDENIHILHEIYEKKLTNADLIEKIKLDIPNFSDIPFYVDEAEQDRKEEMKRFGIRVMSAKKGAGSVKMGIDYLKRKQIFIHPECKNFINEISTYSYMVDSKTDEIHDIPTKVNDHLMDAIRYAMSDLMYKKMITILPRLI